MNAANARSADTALRLTRNRQTGFSLIEILIVIVIIGGIMALIGTQIFGGKDRADVRLTQARVDVVAQKIEQYRTDVGNLPGTLTDLVQQPSGVRGWLGPYAKATDLKDAWNRDFQYSASGSGATDFALSSFGKDGQSGGTSVNADITYEP